MEVYVIHGQLNFVIVFLRLLIVGIALGILFYIFNINLSFYIIIKLL